MYLMHNKINTSTKKVPTLSELFKKARTQAVLEKAASTEVVKTASVVEVKEAGKGVANFGDKKAPPFGKKDNKSTDKSDKDGKEGKEEKESDDTVASSKVAPKVAEKNEDEAETSGQPQAEAKLVNKPELPEGEKAKGGTAKADKDEAETSGQPQAEAKLVNKPEMPKEGKESRITGEAGKVKTARFVRISELTGKQKDFLRKVYEIYWPKDFIDALLAKQ